MFMLAAQIALRNGWLLGDKCDTEANARVSVFLNKKIGQVLQCVNIFYSLF